jgi:arylsulfatase A-like enzyme
VTEDPTDKALEFIRDAQAVAPDKPFFLYYCPGACHAPHHAPKDWIDRYRGKFDMGYEAYREQVFRAAEADGGHHGQGRAVAGQPLHRRHERGRQGLARGGHRAAVGFPDRRREAAVLPDGRGYAGFLSHADHEIGRLPDHLEASGQLDNTIIVLVSDNGASGEGGPNGSVNENKFFNGIPDTIEANLPHLDELGSPATYGKDSGEPVTTDYPGQAPWPFTGGTIHRAAVDVSGQPFVDLAAEVRMAFMRD